MWGLKVYKNYSSKALVSITSVMIYLNSLQMNKKRTADDSSLTKFMFIRLSLLTPNNSIYTQVRVAVKIDPL